MDKYERRRLRLTELITGRCSGVAAAFARAIGRDASYVSRMLYPEGKAGKKRIADDMMEVIEKAFDLPRGWLDGEGLGDQRSTGPSEQTTGSPISQDDADDVLVETRARTLAQRASEIGKLWMELPPERRDEIEAQLRTEVGEPESALKRIRPAKPATRTRLVGND